MKVEFYNLKGNQVDESICKSGIFTFSASRPIVVQPSEIMRVQTDLIVRVSEDCILGITTAHELYKRTGELFPGLITVCSEDKDFILELPVRNGGRSQLNILPGQSVALGFVLARAPVQMGTFDKKAEQASMPKSKPQKKNPGIKFELS